MIQVENLCYEYPTKRVLNNVSFHIQKGRIAALVGPNGAGKTTLMQCITALEKPFSGSVKIDGIDTLEHPREVHKKLGYLSDFFGLYKELTVRQSLEFYARIHELPENKIHTKIDEVVALLQLEKHLNNKTGELSRGFRQIVGIAQALIPEPEILILDEPTSGVDIERRMALSTLFKELQQRGVTILVSSHIISELEDYCDDMLLLRDGKIVQHASTQDQNNHIQLTIKLLQDGEKHAKTIASLQAVTNTKHQNNIITCDFEGKESDLHQLLQALIKADIPVFEFASHTKGLKEIYLNHAHQ